MTTSEESPSGGPADVSIEDLDIALAHWHVRSWGGAEYLVTKMAEVLDLDSVYSIGPPDPDDENPYGDVEFVDVVPSLDYSWLRRLQLRAGRVFEYAMWEDVDWREFGDPDVLITSGATTRSVITPDDTLHVNYCHSPPRWYYDLYHDRKSSPSGKLVRPVLRYLRVRDHAVDSRVDHYFVNSPIIQRRLWKYYKREGEVLFPPINLSKYRNEGNEGYYLHLGRLDKEKGVPAVVEAFCDLEKQLILAGGMGDIGQSVREEITEAPNIEYRGFVSEEEKINLLSRCTAVVFNGRNEDFGIVPIEANASGKACLAINDGFPGIFIGNGQNGYLHDGSVESITKTIRRFERKDNVNNSAKFVDQFDLKNFEDQIEEGLIREVGNIQLG